MKRMFVLMMITGLVGCTDAFVGKLELYGDSARVACYSGNSSSMIAPPVKLRQKPTVTDISSDPKQPGAMLRSPAIV